MINRRGFISRIAALCVAVPMLRGLTMLPEVTHKPYLVYGVNCRWVMVNYDPFTPFSADGTFEYAFELGAA